MQRQATEKDFQARSAFFGKIAFYAFRYVEPDRKADTAQNDKRSDDIVHQWVMDIIHEADISHWIESGITKC